MGNDLGTPTLYAEHVPDVDRSLNPDLTVSEVELPGFLVIGVDVNGTRLELARVKAGHHVDERGKPTFLPDRKAKPEQSQQQPRPALEPREQSQQPGPQQPEQSQQ
jgi:hypothetical protein